MRSKRFESLDAFSFALSTYLFHLRSFDKIKPRSFTESTLGMITPLMSKSGGVLSLVLVKDMCSVFVGWMRSCHCSVQASTTRRASCMSIGSDPSSLTSSANAKTDVEEHFDLILLIRLSMYNTKRRGPRTEPWGTPLLTSDSQDLALFRKTN